MLMISPGKHWPLLHFQWFFDTPTLIAGLWLIKHGVEWRNPCTHAPSFLFGHLNNVKIDFFFLLYRCVWVNIVSNRNQAVSIWAAALKVQNLNTFLHENTAWVLFLDLSCLFTYFQRNVLFLKPLISCESFSEKKDLEIQGKHQDFAKGLF